MAGAGAGVSFETRVLMLITCNIFAVQSAQVFGFCRRVRPGKSSNLTEIKKRSHCDCKKARSTYSEKEGERRYAVTVPRTAGLIHIFPITSPEINTTSDQIKGVYNVLRTYVLARGMTDVIALRLKHSQSHISTSGEVTV